ncbi:mycothione reductase [Stomatohabitans albus]|uniref:mycothione reductase n=1 Tax=Stomatohabitans albus TaxID=3110766 RepID=UPI00300CC18F
MPHYDLAILGTGSGNTIVRSEMKDWKIAVVEPWTFGGTCLNRGCIPSKMFVHAADVAHTAETGHLFNVQSSVIDVHWEAIRDRVFGRIDPIAESGRSFRANAENVDVYDQPAVFIGDHKIKSGDHEFTADRIVISVGSTPTMIDIPGIDGLDIDTSDTIMRLEKKPESLIIIGGGAIATEMGHIFNAYGTKVSMVQRSNRLLSREDVEVGTLITKLFHERGIDMHCGVNTTSIRKENGLFHLELDDGQTVTGERVLMVVGRTPNTLNMHCELTGVELDQFGKVKVNDYMEASAPNIWALGDCANRDLDLKHVANAHARTIAHNLIHPDDKQPVWLPNTPRSTFSQPEVSSVGITEQEANEQGLDVIVHTQKYGNAAYGWALEDTTSFVKVVVDRSTRKLLGAHIIGPQASLLLQILVMGMTFDLTVDDIARKQIWPHPALSEVIEQCLLEV